VNGFSKRINLFLASLKNIKGSGNIAFTILLLGILFVPLFEDIFSASPISVQSFYGKDQLITAVNNFKYYLIKDKLFNGVIANQNGWLIYRAENSMDDFQNTDPFTDDEIWTIKLRLESLCSNLTEKNIKLIFVIPPNKNTVYPEEMPAEIFPLNDTSRLDQVVSYWQDTQNCRMIDLRDTFLEAKKDMKIYNSTDTHWNYFGAFIGYQELAKVLKEDYPSVKIRALEEYDQVPVEYSGDLTSATVGHFTVVEQFIKLVPKFKPNFEFRNNEDSKGIRKFSVTESENPSLPTAIVYHDSFFNFLFQFIGEDFSEAFYYYSSAMDLDLVDTVKPDFLIIESTERYLTTYILSTPQTK
jgi:alginate O-acetyltransferase complex protein AlgJ